MRKEKLDTKQVSLSQIAVQVMVANVKPTIKVMNELNGHQTITLTYDVPPELIKEFDDWVFHISKLSDEKRQPISTYLGKSRR